MAPSPNTPHQRSVAAPRASGGWVVMLANAVIGVSISGWSAASTLALVLPVAGLAGQPLWQRGSAARHVLPWLMGAGAVAATLLWLRPTALVAASLALGAAVLAALARLTGRQRSTLGGQLLAVLGSTLSLPLAAAAGARPNLAATGAAWALSLLFYGAAITSVRWIIASPTAKARETRANSALAVVVLLSALVLVALGGSHCLAGIGLSAEAVRLAAGARWTRHRPPLRYIGLFETGLALWLTGWLVAAVRTGWPS